MTRVPEEQEKQGKQVAVIGGGIGGLSAALSLARMGAGVLLVEKTGALGGHAAQYGCKAAERCVKCGACMVVDRITAVREHPRIEIRLQARIEAVERKNGRFSLEIGSSDAAGSGRADADAVVLATGFSPFDPRDKPYGYGQFPNVITNLALERMLRETDTVRRPSDGAPPARVAFIQCVGSRDAKLGHLWCSQVCCASALRMARWMRSRRPETEITLFYIDIQTFGRDFESFYEAARKEFRMVRTLPADIYPAPEDGLRTIVFDPETRKPEDAVFDLVVLSIGLTPGPENPRLAELFGLSLDDDGFLSGAPADTEAAGVFAAGTLRGPMSIPDTVRSAEKAAEDAAAYLRNRER